MTTTDTPTSGSRPTGDPDVRPDDLDDLSPVGEVAADQLPDPRPLFERAVALGASTLAAVRDDQLALPTPCDEMDVAKLIEHLVVVVRRVAIVGRGEDPFAIPLLAEGEDPLEAYRAAAEEVRQVWADDAVLGRELTLPFAVLPGAIALAIYVSEVTVHTWDLATATGQSPDWDPEVVAMADACMRQALPEASRPDDVPFADAVDVPDGAPAIERLVAWQGRRP